MADLGSEPEGKQRRWVRGFVIGFLIVQALIPLRYYLSDDTYDERFSWRMFSAVRVIECRTIVNETVGDPPRTRPVRLMSVIHEAWVETLKRNREDVIRAFLERRCDKEDVREVLLVNHCVAATGEHVPPIAWRRDCESGTVEEPDTEEDGQDSPQASAGHPGGVRAEGAGGPRTTKVDPS